MAVNPQYRQMARKARGGTSGTDEKNLPVFSWGKVGDTIIGTITFVGDTFEKDNSKFYRPEERLQLADGTEKVIPAKGQKTVTTQKWIVETKDGKFAIYMQKAGHWDAIADGLEAADLNDVDAGLRFRGERLADDDKAHVFEFKFKPAQS